MSGEIKDKTQAEYAISLDYGFLPETKTSLAVSHLARDILENSHQQTFADALGKNPTIPPGHMTTGFYGSRALLPALSKYGRNDVAYSLLLQDTYPSWLYLVKIGATTIWERWDSWMPEKGYQDPRMNSFNMPNLGASIGEWLFSCIGGIETDEVGFRKILIKPHIGNGLNWARTSYDSIRGTIAVRWEKNAGALVMDVTIPANSSATVSIPGMGTAPVTIQESGKTVWSNGAYIKGVWGISGASLNTDRVDVQVASGSYHFQATGRGL